MGISYSSLALDRALNADEDLAKEIRDRVGRSQLNRYRSGSGKPNAETIAWLDQVSGGLVRGNGWGESFTMGAPVVSVEGDGDGWVYIFATCEWVKVGWSKDPERRFRQLIYTSPLDTSLSVVALIGPCQKERELQTLKAFGEPAIGREFFRRESVAKELSKILQSADRTFGYKREKQVRLSNEERSTILRVAAESGADPRTVERHLRGKNVSNVARRSISLAIEKLGIQIPTTEEGND